MSRGLRLAPLALLLFLLAGLVWRLATPVDTTVHSKLEGQAVPAFALPAALRRRQTNFGGDGES